MSELVTSDRELEPGDHVQIYRGLYSHSGIYEGNGTIIHVSNVEKSQLQKMFLIIGSGRAKIRRDDLFDVAGGDRVFKNNYLDAYHSPRGSWKIVESARQLVDNDIPYNVLTNNCENFATLMRNGVSHSEQVDSVKTVAVTGDDKIIHVANVEKNESLITGSGRATIRRDPLSDVARGNRVYKNNSLDAVRRPLEPSKIVERARKHVGQEINYNVLTNNCEHHANWMRNDDFYSKQAKNAEIAGISAGLAATVGCLLCCFPPGSRRQSSH